PATPAASLSCSATGIRSGAAGRNGRTTPSPGAPWTPNGWPVSPDPCRHLPSGQDLRHHLAAVHSGALVAAVVAVGELQVVHAEQVKDRRVQVVDVDPVLHRVEAEVVGRPDDGPGPDATARQ